MLSAWLSTKGGEKEVALFLNQDNIAPDNLLDAFSMITLCLTHRNDVQILPITVRNQRFSLPQVKKFVILTS